MRPYHHLTMRYSRSAFVGFVKAVNNWQKPSSTGLCARRLPEGTPRISRRENAMLAFVQLDTGQSGCRATYRLTFGLYMPWLASMVALLSRLT